MKKLIFKNDKYQMNWLRTDYEYVKISCPEELECRAETRIEGDLVYTDIIMRNKGKKPYFTNKESIAIAFPLSDKYEDSVTCMKQRCHTHIFCGKNSSYICAFRMGGETPHLGMVLTQGRLDGYSIERDIQNQSNDRGCFLLHPEAAEFAPEETKKLSWVVFPHDGKEDFLVKIKQLNPYFVEVYADQYVLFTEEKNRIHICPAFKAEKVRINGEEPVFENGEYIWEYTAEQSGEMTFYIQADDMKTVCRTYVQELPGNLAQKRCTFIAENQQYQGKIAELSGAYLAYDNEEGIQIYRPENDFNGGRERLGMGIVISEYQQYLRKNGQEWDTELEQSLQKYIRYVLRELVDEETGKVYNDMKRDDSYKRLYNAPWAATFFVELYQQYEEIRYLKIACRVMESFYQEGGDGFYPIELPVVELVSGLEKENMTEEAQRMRKLFKGHADKISRVGMNYPPSEVNYEQSIVAPGADVLLSVYMITNEKKYLEAGEEQVRVLELFNGMQPDYHLYETAVRHWDGYWFGKRRYYGDTFPHYWSALSGNVFEKYGQLTGNDTYLKRAEASRRGVLPMFFKNGCASCAYLFPCSINGREGAFYDPYANDQDWGLYFYLRYLNNK